MIAYRPLDIAGALLAGMSLFACSANMAASKAPPGPPLWQVSDEDTTVYLFGLPNLMDADTQWRKPAFDAALADADLLILEADRASTDAQAAMQQTVARIGVYQDGRSLSSVLDPETRARLEAVSESLGVPYQAIERFKPWLAANQLQAVLVQREGLMNPPTPSAFIAAEASRAEMAVSYLETSDALLVAIGSISEDSQIRLLKQALDMIENDPGEARRTLQQWAAGDVEGLAEAFHGEGEWPDDTVREVMLLRRNAAWQSQLEDILEERDGVYFVAVGVGHLVGEDSLVEGLNAAGYLVRRR